MLLIELCPYLVSPILYKQPFSKQAIKKSLFDQSKQSTVEIQNNSSTPKETDFLGEHILHPYFGFVGTPREDYNRFCFPGNDPLQKKSDHQINICLMGGSVAMHLFETSKELLIEKLKASPYFKDKTLNVTLLALGGFKQPQQLMALNYFLSLGAQYDIVINLDGFNEIALAFSENIPYGVSSNYPRFWNFYSRKAFDGAVLLNIAKEAALKKKQLDFSHFLIEKKLFKSNFCLFLWKRINDKRQNTLILREQEINNALNSMDSDYQSSGPEETFIDTMQFLASQIKLWQRCSKIINGIGDSENFEYFHFLQPNQYHQGSKSLTKTELKSAYIQGPYPYKLAVRKGYPLMIKQGRWLKYHGVNFIDLSAMFNSDERTLYNDVCCHFNKLGYNLITEKMAVHILDHFDKKQTR